jgi:hypothetical protein
MEQHGSPRFGGDMDRNEVEIDLNKFMALLQEKSELKDRIRELEDEFNRNPFQKLIFVAEAIDSWRIMDGLVDEIKTIQGITKMLITRATIINNDIIKIDTQVSSALNIAPDLDRIARAQNFVEDGTIDARRD